MDIVIRNCNNIDEAKITIQPGGLNIKYGPNGIGKSTVAKAIAYRIDIGGEGERSSVNCTPLNIGISPHQKTGRTLAGPKKSSRYERLQLFRLITEGKKASEIDDVVQKYINETFHIENEYIMQLNPHKYDSVPEYIVRECDRLFVPIVQ